MSASPPRTKHAIPLTHTGTVIPFTVTSQPWMKRSNCSNAPSAKRTTAMVVKGLLIVIRSSLAIEDSSVGYAPERSVPTVQFQSVGDL